MQCGPKRESPDTLVLCGPEPASRFIPKNKDFSTLEQKVFWLKPGHWFAHSRHNRKEPSGED
jgi:hypothetical protein